MLVIKNKYDLKHLLSSYRAANLSIGFVPTMGALHLGHISLLSKCNTISDISVVSIFVNPTQFNDINDFKKYPITLNDDLLLLDKYDCNVVFIPSTDEIYEGNFEYDYHFGNLETVMEGAFRPGHFKGVAQIVSLLFELIMPNQAYFGLKDFQQLAIIQRLVQLMGYPIDIISCDIVREKDGLAMSSRNVLLTPNNRDIAPKIYSILKESCLYKSTHTIVETKQWVINEINNEKGFKIEYFDIVNCITLQPALVWNEEGGVIGCIALYCGSIRLIDNIIY